MSDFWVSSGHHLVDRNDDGRLVATDAYLKAYLARPEVLPPDDACLVEKAIHQRLMRNPREPIDAAEVATIADRDGRENWGMLLGFRDHLLGHATLEEAYVALIRARQVAAPPLFLNQLVHLVLRNLLDGELDAFKLRAAELLFRPQRLSLKDGIMLLADEEVADGARVDAHASPLVAIFGDARAQGLDVLGTANAPAYAGRSDAFDMVLDFRHGQPARLAFARVLELWVEHLLGTKVTIEPVERIAEDRWSWFVGLDQDGTAIGNALWRGAEPESNGLDRIVALFQLTFADPSEMLEKVAGEPVSLILGMTPGRIVRVKPQNLLMGLPLKRLDRPL